MLCPDENKNKQATKTAAKNFWHFCLMEGRIMNSKHKRKKTNFPSGRSLTRQALQQLPKLAN